MKPESLSNGMNAGAGVALMAGCLICLGLIMVASASMDVAAAQYGNPFYFFERHLVYILIGLITAWGVYQVPMTLWQHISSQVFVFGLVLLALVLVPHVGRRVNGSMRWLGVGPLTMQPSEVAKLCVVLFLSAYLVRRQDEVRETWAGLIKAGVVLLLVAVLLLAEPDFGATFVLMLTAAAMILLAGSGLKRFITSTVVLIGAGVVMAMSRSYRVQRLTAYIHPWVHPFDQGYQLTQSLIAFGRGGWAGAGLGNSVQKLFYLPEAHTDFVFAVFAEEFGLLGVSVVIAMFMALVLMGLRIGHWAESKGQYYNAYVAYGLSILIGVQASVNIGVTSGALPTKGLTLPLVSYGGSSLVVELIMVALLLRVHRESNTAGART
ncbi:MAG: putative lipid II flippase FtsW [Pseudomonadales bacterium]|nr:putative lipid II flippase FtsW [Pseudomonadales bacterium]